MYMYSLSNPVISPPQVWLQYQSLWDMEPANIYSRLETDVAQWQRLLMDVKSVPCAVNRASDVGHICTM